MKNEENLKQVIFHSLLEINQIVQAMSNQQHLVNLANKLVDLQEELQDPKKSIKSILPPITNTNTKGRKKNTKRLDILVEIVRKEDEAKAAKAKKAEKEAEKNIKIMQKKEKRKVEETEKEVEKLKIPKKIKIEATLKMPIKNHHLTPTTNNQYESLLRDHKLKDE